MIRNFLNNDVFMRYFRNTSWMMVENVLKITASFFVAIYIARYLGPENYGILTYVISIVFLFVTVSRLGMETILVRELVKHPDARQEYMGTAFTLMLMGALVSICAVGIFIFFENDAEISVYLFLMSLSLLFQPFYVIDYNFQSQVMAKYSSIAKSFSYIAGSLIKIYLVLINSDIVYFLWAYIFDYFMLAIFLYLMHVGKNGEWFFYHFNKGYIRPLLYSALPLVFSSFVMSLYMAADKLIIKYLLGLNELGIYSAALKMYEGWIFFPMVIAASLLPPLVKLKEHSEELYRKNLTRVFSLVIWSSVLIAIFSTLYSDWIIGITFGEAYLGASNSMGIIMWASAFIGIGTVSYTYFSIEKMENKLIIRTIIALIVNLLLDMLLIPIYGIEGAAIATLVSVISAYYLIDIVDPKTRSLMRIKTSAFVLRKI